MGSVAQAVVEFDEAVQAPWRPPLASASGRRGQLRAVPDPARRPLPGPAASGRAPVDASPHGRRSPSPQTRRPVPVGSRPRRPAPGGTRDARPAPGIRFTRRARRLGAVLGLAVGVVVGSWVGSLVAGDGNGLRLAGESSVVVQQGDTLWSIAASVAGSEDDVRAVIAQIRQLNGLPDAAVFPGQTLLLP